MRTRTLTRRATQPPTKASVEPKNRDGSLNRDVERWLGKLEDSAAQAFNRLAPGVIFPPSTTDREAMAMYLAVQLNRGPDARRRFEALADATHKVILSTVTNVDTARRYLRSQGLDEPSEEDVEAILLIAQNPNDFEVTPNINAHVKMMLRSAAEGAYPVLMERSWHVGRFNEPALLTSDVPVVFHVYEENYDPRRGVGAGNADEIWFPLDPRHILMMVKDDRLGETVRKVPIGLARGFNQTVVDYAFQYLYQHPDQDVLEGLEFSDEPRELLRMEGHRVDISPDGVNRSPERLTPRRRGKR